MTGIQRIDDAPMVPAAQQGRQSLTFPATLFRATSPYSASAVPSLKHNRTTLDGPIAEQSFAEIRLIPCESHGDDGIKHFRL